jgi:hypothetical protein
VLVVYEPVKDRQHLLAVGIDALQIFTERGLEVGRFHPFIHHGAGDVNVLSQAVYIVPAQKESVEESGFPLGGKRIEIISRRHKYLSEIVSIAMPAQSGKYRMHFYELLR